MTDVESMALCAIEYTIGRRSYIVADGQRWARTWGRSPVLRPIIISRLKSAIQECELGTTALGDTMDEVGWREVLAELETMP